MGNGAMKGTKTLGPVWAGSERSGEPAQTAANTTRRHSASGLMYGGNSAGE